MKKKIIILTAVAALAVASIGSTLAYFNAQTGTLNNVMNASDGFYDDDTLLINLFEDFGYDDGDALTTNDVKNYKAGDILNPVPAIDEVVPGQVITKEPYITNEADLDAFVAITVTLNQSVLDYAKVDWNTTDWTFDWALDGLSAVAYYKTALAAGATTANLFNDVTITSTLDDETLPDGTQLTIDLTGYAVQVKDNASTTPQTAIDTEFGF